MPSRDVLRRLYHSVAPITYSIAGYVRDADALTAVANALVTLGAYSALSGADGAYIITGIPAGTAGSMSCAKTGYLWTAITVAAMSGNLTGQDYINAWWAFGGNYAKCDIAYLAKGAESLAVSYANLKNPGTYNSAPGNAPALGAYGWEFVAASSQYLVASGYSCPPTTARSIIGRFVGASGSVSCLAGVYRSPGSNFFGLYPRHSVGTKSLYANGSASNYINGSLLLTSGVIGIAGKKGFLNGVPDANIGAGDCGGTMDSIMIGASPSNGVPSIYATITACGLAVYNETLSDVDMAGAMAALAAL